VLVKGEARVARLVREERDDYDSEWAATKGHLGDEPGDAARVELQGRGRPGDAPGVSIEEPRCG
jgi:transposase